MGIKMPRSVVFWTTSTIKDEKSAAKFHKNSSGDEIANVNFFYNIAHVEASAYAH